MYRSSRVLNQVPTVVRWTMDPTRDAIQLNPSAGTWDMVSRTPGIWDWLNILFKKIPIRNRWLPKPFAAANIHHERAIRTFMASIKAPLGENGWRRQASAGAIPPIVTRVGKEVVTLEGGDDFMTQAGEDETAALATPDGSGEGVTVGAILPVARWRARVVPTRFGRSRSVAIFSQLEANFSTLASNLAKLASMASCHSAQSR